MDDMAVDRSEAQEVQGNREIRRPELNADPPPPPYVNLGTPSAFLGFYLPCLQNGVTVPTYESSLNLVYVQMR